MWSRIFFMLTLVLFVNHSLAQDFSYFLHEVPLVFNSASQVTSNGTSHTGMFIGSHHPGGVRTGFIYDHYGIINIDAPRTTYDLTDLLTPFPTEWTGSSCVGINEMGQVVGAFERTVTVDGVSQLERRGFLLDLFPTAVPNWTYLPTPDGATSSYGRKINNSGLVVIQAEPYAEYLFDSRTNGLLIPLLDPNTGLPFNFPNFSRLISINDAGQVLGTGTGYNPDGGQGYIMTPGVGVEWAPFQTSFTGMNQSGEWCGQSYVVNRNNTTTLENAVRFTVDKGFETLSTEFSNLRGINDSGDAAGGFNRYGWKAHKPAVYHNELGWILLDGTRIKGATSDLSLWSNLNSYRQVEHMTNRNAIGLPDVVARAELTTTTGKGKTAVTTNVRKYYYMEAKRN